MATRIIQCFSESLDSKYHWNADQAHTFEMATAPGNDPWPEMSPVYNGSHPAIHGLLAMGEGLSYPFSFAQRGFPANASREVTTMWKDSASSGNGSYLTFAELEAKSAELLVLSDAKALAVRPEYLKFLSRLPVYNGNPAHHRIVFWFA